jgi:glycerol-3-phosphate acyltransferase PlsY
LAYLAVALLSYLLGSIPFALLAAKLAGLDIREHGSGNIGATNVVRVLGWKYGYPVFVADALKGLVAVRLAILLATEEGLSISVLGVIAAVAAIFGHSFPVWLRFRGGKGVATSGGAVFGLMPTSALVAGAVWIVTFFVFRYVSIASMAAAVSLPLSLLLISYPPNLVLIVFSILVTALVILRHRSNIKRLLQGTEPRFDRR